MKKKTLSVALALVMVFALAGQAMAAAPSVSVDTAPDISGVTDSKGEQLDPGELTVTPVKDAADLPAETGAALQEAYQEISSSKSAADFIKNENLTDAADKALEGTKAEVTDLAVNSVFDVSATGAAATALANGGLKMTFGVSGVKAGDPAVVLHKDAASGWEVVPSTTGNGTVTATFTSLSPVVILTSNVQSPGTGDINVAGYVACAALLCAMGAAFALKKAH